MTPRSFCPNTTQNIVVAATQGRVKLQDQAAPTQVRVANDGTATVWILFGGATVAATSAAGIPITAGSVEVFTIPSDLLGAVYVSAIAAGPTGTIYFTTGVGV